MKSMMKLLAVGNGIHGGKVRPNPYRSGMKLPRFNERNPFAPARLDQREDLFDVEEPAVAPVKPPARAVEPAPSHSASPAAAAPPAKEACTPTPEAGPDGGVKADEQEGLAEPKILVRNAVRRRKTFFSWLNPFRQTHSGPREGKAVQAELSLEAVRVKRNDLVDDDLEVVRGRGKGGGTDVSTETVWGRLTARIFNGESV